MKYLVYDPDYDHVIVATQKPPSDYIGMTHPELGEGLIQVWHSQKVQLDTVRLAILVLLHRSSTHRLREKGGNQSLIVRATIPFDQINSAVDQIESRYRPDDYAFIAVGASPKIVKWILKRKGYETKAINVSNVKAGVTPTSAFEAYVKRKLRAIVHEKIVVIDYVDSGEALSVIKDYVFSIWKRHGKGRCSSGCAGRGTKV